LCKVICLSNIIYFMGMLRDENEIEVARICGKNIKKLRERDHYSQEKLAEYLDCSTESIGKVERGLQMMKIWRLIRLCELFHVSLDYLLRNYDPANLTGVPSYFVKLFHDADDVEFEILSDHMMSAGREIDRKKGMESKYEQK